MLKADITAKIHLFLDVRKVVHPHIDNANKNFY